VGKGVKVMRGRMRRWDLNRYNRIKGVGNWSGNRRMHCIALENIPWDDFESIIWLAAVEAGIR
jgi:hypothetical protein